MKEIYFYANMPMFRGAPQPPFNEKKVNVTEFDDGLRPKEDMLCVHLDEVNPDNSYGVGEWLSQDSEYAEDAFIDELKRAFVANGLPHGCKCTIKFGIRDTGFSQTLEFTV